ncbi:hypothetical protein CVD25_08430 [Bacillus canaveralius]|uniref:Uncharacterized protein n=1 Tax=Bacillus canaveralius TaxID=1403243 RepID=A0A2N5GIC0_9BACI|nr:MULTISPECIES: hypothetical protein [Bacillus]PLR80739.1 hypothetical protein CU635_16940 [Bacillus canaveralius]PLR81729.1 hypothetical protein CVD23_18310 [Bacillus sp. V33-4]PLR98383.1 hypothetical protein CVD25_08430 [Bacillus canaveralius]RSK53887.1 hypothetical protein EJA13_07195 [Bacillus canaveralius]
MWFDKYEVSRKKKYSCPCSEKHYEDWDDEYEYDEDYDEDYDEPKKKCSKHKPKKKKLICKFVKDDYYDSY